MGVYILASIALNIVVGFFLSDTSVNEIGMTCLVIFGFGWVPTDMLSAFLTKYVLQLVHLQLRQVSISIVKAGQ